jgi:hypothetical protein
LDYFLVNPAGSLVNLSSPQGIPTSTSLSSISSLEFPVAATMEKLLHARQTLCQGADTQTLVMVRLLEEQQHVCCRDSSAYSQQDVHAATPPSAHSYPTEHHCYYATVAHAQNHTLQQQQQQQQHCFSLPHRSLY